MIPVGMLTDAPVAVSGFVRFRLGEAQEA